MRRENKITISQFWRDLKKTDQVAGMKSDIRGGTRAGSEEVGTIRTDGNLAPGDLGYRPRNAAF
ncbi:hypothetical protein B1222_22095 [Paenibacillus larvae subsp. pulvifaciens]|uniref:hypothetical protein n=1 Tax=Paenibacillus larvae TaxID=1464 RepID=UPI000990132D|nr:hypothetical protein [Paenibacillus larvae]AQT86476.1 hypothetical protein B1222_22095 [Paenibacillus larvae subsp. pulvifaciens]AQZ48131.1 hypothetical protein B5S25_17670 [Paenibacillus larvae subsp. pulvifaciens]MBH0340918.1 hypothetical protein [Paenibacillus larvae]MEC0188713.1 hypothetical protein [Paenibacillus larvae]